MKMRTRLPLLALAAVVLAATMNPGAAQARGVVYVAGSGNEFGTLDLTTGQITNIGTLALPGGDNVFGMGFGSDGKLYGLDSQIGAGGAHLWLINTSNAGVTDLGAVGQTSIDSTADASGKMYGLTQDPTAVLYTLNPPSTTPTVVGPVGFTGTGLAAVNAAGTQLFGGATDMSTGTTDLYSIDPTTGTSHFIGDTGFFVINGLFVNTVLYGFDDTTNAIVTINTSTGAATQVATYSFGAGNTDVIFASATPTAVPEPSSVVLVAIGLAACGSLGLRRQRTTKASA